MRQYIPELMPLIVDALLDGAAVSKREVAVVTLGQVVQSTGYVLVFCLYIKEATCFFVHDESFWDIAVRSGAPLEKDVKCKA